MRTTLKKAAIGLAAASAVLGLAAAAQAKTQLTMYYPVAVGGPLTKIVDDLIAGFEKQNPDVSVKAIYAGNYDDARVKALAALNSGEPGQLAVLYALDSYELIEQGAIIPFDEFATTPEDKTWLKSFYPALMENGTIQGKTWGIPFQRSTIVMYYNKDAFKEVGLDPEKPPQNWDELTKMSQKLVKKEADGTVSRWGVMVPSTGYPYWMFQAFAMQNGQLLMNNAGNEVYFDTPASVEALTYWRDLGTKYGVMPTGTIEWATLRQAFTEGKTAIMWHTTGNLTAVKDTAKFNFGVAMLPAMKQRGSPTGGGNFYIFKKTSKEEQQAALKLIKYLTQPERTAEWSIKTGYVGTRPDAYETPALKKYAQEFPPAVVARDQLKFASAEFSTYQTGRVRKLLSDAIQAVLTGAKQPKEAMSEAQKQADALLRRYK